MPELIERGHIYIAQPPLYKLKKGKQEDYLLDDEELNGALLQTALDGSKLFVSKDAPPLGTTALESLARDYQVFSSVSRRLAVRYDPHFLQELVRAPKIDRETLKDEQRISAWCDEVEASINARQTNIVSSHFSLTYVRGESNRGSYIELTRFVHGISEKKMIPLEFFNTADYDRIADYGIKVEGLIEQTAYVSRGERAKPIADFGEGVRWLLADAQRGYSIQRYKGLGEMNPEQLWDTTMNPEARRLLRVTIEDAVSADQIFTTLMGDSVEPRREFIERYALDVENLDV